MKYTCSLCGGKLKDGICTECGMDNRKSDEMYQDRLNRSQYDHASMKSMSHVHTEEGAEKYKQPVLNENRKKSNGDDKGASPRQDPGADRKTMAGSAPAKKQARNSRYQNIDFRNIKRGSLASGQRKSQPPRLTILALLIGIVILAMLGLSVASFLGISLDEPAYVGVSEESYDMSYDYEEIQEQLPAQGEYWNSEIPAGMYMVGTDIPEGEYSVTGPEGSSFEVHDNIHSIYIQESFGTDEYEIKGAEGIPLFTGALICVDGKNPVFFKSENAQTEDLESRIPNPVADQVDVTGTVTAGVDFPAGTYDIQAAGDNFGYVTYEIPYEDPYSEGGQSYHFFGIMLEKDPTDDYPEYCSVYRNVVLPEGAVVSSEDYQCRLVPSSSIISEDYQSYYENMY